ncbi:sodium-translocating pyrophosphatase [Candidatus Peribacteria bacterium]|nr:MAG: sodium-translocating pyrophosphatase [Candidatus Peribacteria bacterium]
MTYLLSVSLSNSLGIVALSGVIALVFAAIFRFIIGRESDGTDVMQKIAGKIRVGAMAFLTKEYSVIVPFMIAVGVLLYLFLDVRVAAAGEHNWGAPYTALSFIMGGVCSGLAGLIGMRTATMANVRTAQAARTSMTRALRIAFMSGATMGLAVVGLGLLGFTGVLYYLLQHVSMTAALQSLTGFSFGASCVALFARVGGGIYTKAADVGADLVGKVEAGIPEDDPRNPAVIADNVGDNVGDVAGMGADLFESYIGAILATMLVGLHVTWGIEYIERALLYPLFVSAIGVIATIIATYFVRTKKADGVQAALKNGMIIASVLMLAGTWFFTKMWLPVGVANSVFFAVTAGLVAGVLVGGITEYYTSHSYGPVRALAHSSKTGAGTVLIEGLALGYLSTALPLIVIVLAMGIAYVQAGLYGIGAGAVGMLSTLGMTLAIDAFGPVADNAGGIAEMSKLPHEVRERTDALDAAGNTTAAIGKGFAIAVAGFMCLALFGAFKEESGLESIDVSNAFTLIGLLIGGMLPFLFSSMTMRAVSRAAIAMIEEVRRQFREIKGLMEGTAEGDTARCVSIATASAIRQMILPGVLAIVSPVFIGLLLGREALGGLLAGALVSSMMLGMSMANSGGAWDNAKKYIESGNLGGKGSDPHKAAVVGDTVGDPFKDTSGPALNILVKLMSIVSVLTASLYGVSGWWN